MTRPKRKHIPIAVKREVAARQGNACPCGCGTMVLLGKGAVRWCKIHWDHSPALRLRDVNRAGTDYIPPQNDPNYLVARCVVSHRIKTVGAGTSRKRSMAGTDIGKIVKERRRARQEPRKRPWLGRRVSGTKKAAHGLPTRSQGKIPSRPFSKIKRPMRRKP